ncbi:poly(ADP-ribose) glycohydrolase domain-containing protein [Legionella sp. WA2024007413]
MRAYRELRHLPNSIPLSKIKEVHSYSRPGFLLGIFSGNGWRHKSMEKTIDHSTDPKLYNELKSHAAENLKAWEKEKVEPPQKVEVVCRDFGDAALEATKKHGRIYPILNMANSLFPGGAALEGGSAQEENMWHRSSCVRSLGSRGIYYDETQKCFLYDEHARRLLTAEEQMSPEELESLGIRRGIKIPQAYKVFMNDEPQICFRGPEILVPISSDELASKKQFVADSALSYTFLPKNKIFPFYELRSAAPELVDRTIDFKNEDSVREYTQDLSRRIGAQLDTLILKGKTDAIMGAWGCGSFKNNPEVVAKIYSEEIEKRAQHFQHIIFPIIDAEHRPNFEVFKKHLDGIKLGNLATKSNTKTPVELNPYGLYAQGTKKVQIPSKEELSDPWKCTIL